MAWQGWGKDGAEEDPKGGKLERIATLGAGALGLVGFLYALGGVVIWLRVQAAQLSPNGIVTANDRHLLEVGVSVVAFELFLLLAIGIVVAVLVALRILLWHSKGTAPAPSPVTEPAAAQAREPGKKTALGKLERAWEDEGTLAGIVLPTASLILLTVGLSLSGDAPRAAVSLTGLGFLVGSALGMIFLLIERFGKRVKLKPLRLLTGVLLAVALALGIFVLPLLQGTILLAGTTLAYLGTFLRWPDPKVGDVYVREVVQSTGLWVAIALSTFVALAWVATPPVSFTHARLNSLDRAQPQNGAYLDRGDGGVYVGTCITDEEDDWVNDGKEDGHQTSTESRVILVPAEASARVRLGQETYHFDPGGRPSLWQTFKTVVGGGVPGAHDAPLDHSLRGEVDDVCGGS